MVIDVLAWSTSSDRKNGIQASDVSTMQTDTFTSDFSQEQEVLAGAKPQSVMSLLTSWFENTTPKVELFASHNNLCSGWVSLGNDFFRPGLHAVSLLISDIPI